MSIMVTINEIQHFQCLVMKEMLEDAELLPIEPQHGVVGRRWAIKIKPPVDRITLSGRLVYGWRERRALRGQSKRAKRRAQLFCLDCGQNKAGGRCETSA